MPSLSSPKAVLDVGRLLADKGKPVSVTWGVVKIVSTAVITVDMGAGNTVTMGTLAPVKVGDLVWILVQAERAVILGAELSGYQTFLPRVDQGATTNIAKTVNYSRFVIEGWKCIWNFELVVSGAGTAGSSVSVTLPTPGVTGQTVVGTGEVYDSSAGGRYTGKAGISGTTLLTFSTPGVGNTNPVGITPNFALANGDIIRAAVEYQVP
jgi:hypothetical protein